MKIHATETGLVLEDGGRFFPLKLSFDELLNQKDLTQYLRSNARTSRTSINRVLAPIGTQEVWAAGVTYLRSRDARMDESNVAGASDFYDKVYSADRPELFFKATARRVVGHDGIVRLRADSQWTVPEPELALLISSRAKIVGYTIGNDMSCRDIEGANPLYLPQAKIYNGACALGPCVLIAEEPLAPETKIELKIVRQGAAAFSASTTLSRMKRTPQELVDWLYRNNSFPTGAYLLTGTGIVPPNDFTLQSGDDIYMKIEPIGELHNRVG